MKLDNTDDFASGIRPLDAAEVEAASGALGPLAIIGVLAVSAAAGVVAGVLTSPGNGGGSGITWQQIINTAQGRPPA